MTEVKGVKSHSVHMVQYLEVQIKPNSDFVTQRKLHQDLSPYSTILMLCPSLKSELVWINCATNINVPGDKMESWALIYHLSPVCMWFLGMLFVCS